LFISQVIFEHEEPQWNDINRGKLLVCLPELWQFYHRRHLIAKQEKNVEEMLDFAYEVSLS
jgi:hypothetical protein